MLTKPIQLSKVLGLFFLMGLFFTSNVYAQERTITGIVTDAKDGSVLPGVNVAIEGTTIGSITDFDGKFSLMIDESDGPKVLSFSFIGYITQSINVGSKSNITVQLAEDIEQLEEVVVVGYGVQKKSVVTGAIASVKSEEITETPVGNAAQSLQGRTPGVLVTNVSGQPGAGVDIRIRGTGSNGHNSPLFVVDGMQMDDINFLNPNDIESMEVLKDAASSAIYGSRGANGVVMITTKKGKSGKATVTYDGYYGVQNAWRESPLLNAQQYMTLHNQGAVNAGQSPIYSNAQIANPVHDTNWQNELFQSAPIQNHSISSSGGNENSNYLASFGYFGQDGIVAPEKSQFERYTFRLNTSHKVSESVKVGVNATFVREERRGINEHEQFGGAIQNALLHDPLTPVYEYDKNNEYSSFPVRPAYNPNQFNPVTGENGAYYGISERQLREIVNPMAKIHNTYETNLSNKFIGNAFVEVKPVSIKGLTMKTDFGVDVGSWANRGYSPEVYYNSVNQVANSSVNQSMNEYSTWQWENTAMYEKTINADHKISVLGGMTMRQSTGTDMWGMRNGLQLPGWDYGYIGNGADDNTQKTNGGFYDHRLMSFFGRVGYDYKEKYLFSATMRYDGSSNFSPAHQFGFFPSLQAGWVISNEDFLKYNETVNFLKVRGSWGKVGNENIPPFGYMSAFVSTPSFPLGPAGVPQPGYGNVRMGNPDLRWEAAAEFNLGIDVGLFNDMLQANIDLYSRERQDLLGNKPVPDYTGQEDPITNLGTVRNQGIELALTYQNNEGEFKYSITGNVAYNDNKVTAVNNTDGFIFGDGLHNTVGNMAMATGHSLPFFYGFKTDGVIQNQQEADRYNEMFGTHAKPGDIRFVDTNGDGVIDENDRTDIGTPVHNWTYGLTIRAEYKGFDFSMFWQGQAGGKMMNASTRRDLLGDQNYDTRYLNSWTPENGSNTMPRFTHDDTNNNYLWMNDMVHIEDASYLRLKNVQVGYTLPSHIAKKIGTQRLRVYVSGNNLLTFTEYSGLDPEMGHGGAMGSGFDMGSYPQARSYLVGLNVTF
ncbi:TonB-dependent receptor [Flammeovirga sp. OC4]|uniref:SusC/RagA family TonB-linked outer membrane protein n=1 Tax=Flammeovirga sp. OC4 TaxID=1382345 RepID=UPI000694C4DC|nr:TonB-dependent receptor [Flammeovirga sp. OC4]